MNLDELVELTLATDVQLDTDGAALHYDAPAELPAGHIAQLRLHKAGLIRWLSTEPGSAGVQSRHPPSYGQLRLWTRHREHPNPAVYNIRWEVDLDGELDPPALAAALNALVRRHEALRTRFVRRGGVVVAEVMRPAAVPLPVLPPADPRLAAIDEPFDPATAPLLRAALVRHHERRWTLLLVMHHLVCDHTSLAIMLDELSVLYRDPGHELAPAGQYAEFARWERHALDDGLLGGDRDARSGWMDHPPASTGAMDHPPASTGAMDHPPGDSRPGGGTQGDGRPGHGTRRERLLRHWRAELSGARLRPALPYGSLHRTGSRDSLHRPGGRDRPRPANPSRRGAEHRFTVGGDVLHRLDELASRCRTTRYTVLCSAFATLLARITGEPEVVVISSTGGRTLPEHESIVGNFTDALPLRVRVAQARTFADLVAQVGHTVFAALDHRPMPLGMLVADLEPADLGAPGGEPPVPTVLFTVLGADPPVPRFPGVRATLVPPAPSEVARMELYLTVVPYQGGLVGSAEYATELFDASTVAAWCAEFVDVLRTRECQ